MSTQPNFETALTAFVAACQALIDEYRAKNFPMLDRVVLTTDPGRRYVRIVRNERGSRSVYCFVDKTNGDILKSATWKAPAKIARGSIYDADPTKAVTVYGANYLK